jgi:hypothetical protein
MEALQLDEPLSFSTFDPRNIAWQYRVLWDQHNTWNYSEGVISVLYSGSVGSAKTCLASFQAIQHCLKFTRARTLLAGLSFIRLNQRSSLERGEIRGIRSLDL